MGRRASLAIGFGLLAAWGAGAAEAQRSPRTIVTDFRNSFADMFYVWKAPLRADSRDWAAAGGVVGSVIVISAFDGLVNDYMLDYPNSAVMQALEPVRVESKTLLFRLGGSKVIYPMTASLYGIGFLLDSRPLREAAMGCVTAYQAQSVVHEFTYHVISRRRPYVSGGDPYAIEFGKGPWDDHSFYGGHAANFLTCATVWNNYFDLGIAEPVLYTIGIGIGLGRMADGHHWTSDTALGMVMGYAVGRIVAGRFERRRDEREGRQPAGGPVLDGLTLGRGAGGTLVVGWQRTF